MKRFLAVLALVVVAGAVYVAASPGAQQAGPTAKQFNALKKTVTKLQKQLKSTSEEAAALDGFVSTCMAHAPVAVDSVGSSTDGYLFGAPGATPEEATTALNLAASTETSPQYRFFALNASNSSCVSIVNTLSSGDHTLSHISALNHH